MTLGMVTPALAAQTEANVQSAACTCTAACTEETRNMDCAMCGAEGAPLTDCAQVNAQDDTNNEQQTANAENGFEYTVTGDEATITGYTGSAESLVIPSELGGKPVTEIGAMAFSYCSSLTKATIPEGVTSIGEYAFSYCSSLTEVTIPKSVTSMEDRAFYECKALTTVHYGGTQEDWEALKKNIGEENTPLLNANIICKEKPKICKGGKEVKISNGAHEMRIHGKSYGTFTFAWVNDKAAGRFRMPTASIWPLTTASWFCVTRRMFGSMTRSSTRRRKKRQAPAGAGGAVRAPR